MGAKSIIKNMSSNERKKKTPTQYIKNTTLNVQPISIFLTEIQCTTVQEHCIQVRNIEM